MQHKKRLVFQPLFAHLLIFSSPLQQFVFLPGIPGRKEMSALDSNEDLVQRHGDTVYRLAYARLHSTHDADDVFQEVFLRCFCRAPVFETTAHERAWLVRVTINCCKSLWSAPWRQRIVPLTEELAFSAPEETGLNEAMAALSPLYRTVLHLFYYEGYTAEEIARLLHRRPATVRSQLARARAKLGEALKGDEFHAI